MIYPNGYDNEQTSEGRVQYSYAIAFPANLQPIKTVGHSSPGGEERETSAEYTEEMEEIYIKEIDLRILFLFKIRLPKFPEREFKNPKKKKKWAS